MGIARGWREVPLYPAFGLIALVLNVFVDSTAAGYSLLRPLVIGTAGVIIVQVALGLVFRNRYAGAVLTAAAVLFLADLDGLAFAVIVGLLVVASAAAVRRQRLASLPWPRFTQIANTIGFVVVLLAAFPLLSLNSVWATPEPATTTTVVQPPDVYLILLDGHPRLDTVESAFGLDTSAFVGAMSELGFEWAPTSRANYNATTLTLASMFNMELMDGLVARVPAATPAQFRLSTELINRSGASQRFVRPDTRSSAFPPPFRTSPCATPTGYSRRAT